MIYGLMLSLCILLGLNIYVLYVWTKLAEEVRIFYKTMADISIRHKLQQPSTLKKNTRNTERLIRHDRSI